MIVLKNSRNLVVDIFYSSASECVLVSFGGIAGVGILWYEEYKALFEEGKILVDERT